MAPEVAEGGGALPYETKRRRQGHEETKTRNLCPGQVDQRPSQAWRISTCCSQDDEPGCREAHVKETG